MGDEELEKFDDSMKPTVARKIGESNMDKVSKDEMQRLTQFALKYVDRTDTGVTDRRDANNLDETDIQNLGNLKCGLTDTDVQKLNKAAIENNVFDMGQNCDFDTATGAALFDRAKEKVSGLLDSADTVVMVGGLLGYASDADQNSISDGVWQEALVDVGEVMKTRKENQEKRDISFSNERNSTEKETEKGNMKGVLRKGLEALVTSATTRRRRSTPVYTCSDIEMMGDPTALSASDISSLSDTEFSDCAETLGSESDWDSDQLEALKDVAVSAWGGASSWTTAEVTEAGSITAGLSVNQISSLTLNADAMSSIGSYDIFSTDQLAAGFSNYLSTEYPSGTAADLSSDNLVSLGAFSCGATTADISDISVSAYRDSASTIGEQSACSSAQLASFAGLAQSNNGFGSVSTWDSSTISTVGSVIGGLTTSQISSLTESQISAITPTNMALIPPTSFSGFSATQIGYFGTSQAAAVTYDQGAALSEDAQAALEAAGGYTADSYSGAGEMMYSGLLLLISGVLARM